MGGMAVRAHGLPRPTYDVDIAILIDRDELPTLFDEIDSAGYDIADVYKSGWADSVAGMPVVKATTFDDGRAIVADLFLAETEFLRVLVDRRLQDEVDGVRTWLISPEDLVILKLVADRDRDRADVQDILAMNPTLDQEHLKYWSGQLGVADNLRKALNKFNS